MSFSASGEGERDVECNGEEGMLSLPRKSAGVVGRVFDSMSGLADGPVVMRGGLAARVLAPVGGEAADPVAAV